MEDFKQKISTGNVFMQTQVASALYSKILNQDNEDIDKSPEVVVLYQYIRRGNASEAGVAGATLLALVNKDKIQAVTLLTNLLADVLTAACPAPTVQVITQLMLIMSETNWSDKQQTKYMPDIKQKIGQSNTKEKNTKKSDANNKDEPQLQATDFGAEVEFIHLRNPFTGPPVGPVSPYVTLVRKKPDLAYLVLEECEYLLHHPDKRVQEISFSMVQPLLLYAACLTDGSVSLQQLLHPLLALLQRTHCSMQHSSIIPALLQAARLARCSSSGSVQCKVWLLCATTSLSLHDRNTALQHAMLPALVTALAPATSVGVSTRQLLRLIGQLIVGVAETGCDVTLAALATTLPHVTSTTLPHLLKFCGQLLCSSSSNPLVCCTLLPALLQLLAAPCALLPAVTAAASTLVAIIQHNRAANTNIAIRGNPHWGAVCQLFPSLASLVRLVEVCGELVTGGGVCARQWLSAVSAGGGLGLTNQLAVTAVFLYEASPPEAVMEAARTLEREVVKGRFSAIDMFPMMLYRLAHDRQPETRLALLHLLPSLAANKLCVPLVLKTVLSLYSSGPRLRPVLLRVLLDTWRVEPRVYPHLLKLVTQEEGTGKGPRDGELSIAKAYVISVVCKEKASQHGEELLPVLSELLNRNSRSSSVEYTSCTNTSSALVSSSVCCFALTAITQLVSAGVIDLRTTWRVLAPQLAKDRRPEVLCSLCSLLALAATLQVKSDEYETFTNNILNILWSWTNHHSKSVVESAYTALQGFNMSLFRFKMLPSYSRLGIKLPDSLAATPFEAARKPEDVLTYVPGEAWINLVRGAKTNLRPCLESFVQSLIKREVAGLYKGIYLTAMQEAKKRGLKGSGGKPEPLTYDFLKEYSTLKATVNFLHQFPKELEACSRDDGDKLLHALLVFLRALGQPLNRPFPALDWIILSDVQDAAKSWCEKNAKIDWDEKIRHAIFDILAKQCNKSASASAYMIKFLVPNISNGLSQKDEIHLFGLMDYLGRGIPPASLQPFIAFTLNRYVNDAHHLKLLLDSVHPVLTSEFIHDTNRNALGNTIESLNEKIDPTDDVLYSSYKACIADLPSKHIERLTSPSLWWEVTDEKLFRAAVLRCHVAVRDPDEMALPWLNDIVDSAASLPGERTALLKVLAETLTVRCSDVESSTWFLQLLGQLLDQTKKKVADNLVANHEHNQRILFYCDLLIVSIIIWSNNHINYGIDRIVETPSICDKLINSSIDILFERPVWQITLPQLLNFLVSSLTYLNKFIGSRYNLGPCTVVMANRCPSLSQQMWNKVVTLNITDI